MHFIEISASVLPEPLCVSEPRPRPLTYGKYATRPGDAALPCLTLKYRGLAPSAFFGDLLCQPRRADLLCTTSTPRVLPGGAFAHLIRIRRFRVPFLLRTWGTPSRAILRDTASRSPSWMLTYVRVRSRVAIRAKLQESRLKKRLSVCLRAIAPFPRKACSL